MDTDADSQKVPALRILRRMLSLRGHDGPRSAEGDGAEVPSSKGYAPIDERGGTVTVEGDPGPVGAIAYLASTAGRGERPAEEKYERLLKQAFALTDGESGEQA